MTDQVSDEDYRCVPCKSMNPNAAGELTVPGGTNATVWCPWCGDEMELVDDGE